MIQKFFKIIFPVSLIVMIINFLAAVSGLAPGILGGLPAFVQKTGLSYISPVITSLLLLSIGYYIVKKVYNPKIDNNYEQIRHLVMSSIFVLPLIPILFTPAMLFPYITGKAFAFRFLGIVLFVSFVYMILTSKNFKFRLTPFTGSITIFTILIGISNLFSGHFGRSFSGNFERMDGYLTVLLLWTLTVALTSLKLKDTEWLKLGKIHVGTSIFISGLGALQYFIGIFKLTDFSIFPILNHCLRGVATACKVDSTLGNSIYLGIYGGLTAWLIIYYIIKKNWKVSNLTWFAFLLNLLTPIIFTTTRSVWIGIFSGIFVTLIIYFWLNKNKKAVITSFVGIILLIVLVSFFTYFQDRAFVQNLPFLNRLLNVNTLLARFNVWDIALRSTFESPLTTIFGWGQESFINAFNKNFNPLMFGQEVYFDHPHNSYVGWLFMGGVLGLLAYLSTLVGGIWGAIKTYFTKGNGENNLSFAIVFGAITTYLVHSFFVFDNLITSLMVILLFVYFGRNYAFGNIVLGNFEKINKTILKVIFFVFALILLWLNFWKPINANKGLITAMTYDSTIAGYDSNKNAISVLQAKPAETIKKTETFFENILNMNTFATAEILDQYLQKCLTYINFAKENKSLTENQEFVQSVVEFKNTTENRYISFINQHPYEHKTRFALGLYYTSLGDLENAKKYLTEAVNLAPNKQIAILQLAKILLVKGEKEEAFKLYQKTLDVTPRPTSQLSTFRIHYNSLRMDYVKALLFDNRDEQAINIIQEMFPVENAEDFQSLINSIAQIYSAKKDLKNLIVKLESAINANSANANLYLWLAQAYVVNKQYDNAVKVISVLNSQYPQIVNAFMAQLQELVKTGQVTK